MDSTKSSFCESSFEVFPEKYIQTLNDSVDCDLDDRVILSLVRLLSLVQNQKQRRVMEAVIQSGYEVAHSLDGESLLARTQSILQVIRGVRRLQQF